MAIRSLAKVPAMRPGLVGVFSWLRLRQATSKSVSLASRTNARFSMGRATDQTTIGHPASSTYTSREELAHNKSAVGDVRWSGLWGGQAASETSRPRNTRRYLPLLLMTGKTAPPPAAGAAVKPKTLDRKPPTVSFAYSSRLSGRIRPMDALPMDAP